jgi:hypothetical protein
MRLVSACCMATGTLAKRMRAELHSGTPECREGRLSLQTEVDTLSCAVPIGEGGLRGGANSSGTTPWRVH